MWGAELELAWRPTPRFRANANFGYLGTRIANGMKSIDVMNRTQGNPDWVLVKPWLQIASNCIVPKETLEKIVNSRSFNANSPLAAIAPICGASWIGDFRPGRSEEHTYELQSLMRISYAVLCVKKKKKKLRINCI